MAKRTLRSGNEYDRFFEKASCKPTYLGQNDTKFTVSQMKKWATKYSGQTKELALGVFKGMDLERTTESIFQFLHDHIQYQLDGSTQNLKSPACAWATRTEGTDCKSYSIFASTLLINLGIKHYFRRVKQPYLEPDKWTHVYVVVPRDQKTANISGPGTYYIVDATVHDNKEVEFSQKDDTLMSKVSLPHYGLNAPANRRKGLGCSCRSVHPAIALGVGDPKVEVVPFGTTPAFGGGYTITAPTINNASVYNPSSASGSGKFGTVFTNILDYGTQAANAILSVKNQVDQQKAANQMYASQYNNPNYAAPGYNMQTAIPQQGYAPADNGGFKMSTTNIALLAAAALGGVYLLTKK